MNVSPSILKKTLDVKILVFVGLLFLSINVIVRGSENENDLHFFEQNYETLEPTAACMPTFCNSTNMQSKYVLDFCTSHNFTVQGRCCIHNETNTTRITGIDYSTCEIQKLTTTLASLDPQSIRYVKILDIQMNPVTECDKEAFGGFVNLNTLYHPQVCECPGGNYSWSNISNEVCFSRKDLCNTTFVNSNCTVNSKCVENGPGNILCNCKSGYHGYKCLEEGTFPAIEFTLVSCVTTVVLSALLWFTQRRHVIKNE